MTLYFLTVPSSARLSNCSEACDTIGQLPFHTGWPCAYRKGRLLGIVPWLLLGVHHTERTGGEELRLGAGAGNSMISDREAGRASTAPGSLVYIWGSVTEKGQTHRKAWSLDILPQLAS